MSWFQKEILISPKKRGFHIITNEVLNQLEEILLYKVGILHLFINNDFTRIMKSVVVLTILVALMMGESFRSRNKLVFFEYPVITLFAVLGMLFIISANNFILFSDEHLYLLPGHGLKGIKFTLACSGLSILAKAFASSIESFIPSK